MQIKTFGKYGVVYNSAFETVLPTIESGSVDCVIIDPPYLSTDLDFDKKGFDMPTLKKEIARILKPNGYLISFGTIELLAAFCPEFKIRFSGVWLKQQATLRTHSAKKPKSQCEPYSVYTLPKVNISELTWNELKIYGYSNYKKKHSKRTEYKRGGKDSIDRASTQNWTKDNFVYNVEDGSRCQPDVIYANNKAGMKKEEQTIHPTQKPISLIETLIKWTTNENDLILDCFIGSGTTALAGIRTKRKVIGVELFEDYFDITCNRIEKEIKLQEQNLF